MALKDYIAPDSYSTVENLSYNKKNKTVSFNLEVYANDSKEDLITSIDYSLVEPPKFIRVKSVMETKPALEDGEIGEEIVYMADEGDLVDGSNMVCKYIEFEGSKVQSFYIAPDQIIAKSLEDGKKYIYSNDKVLWRECDSRVFDEEIFDQFFSVAAMSSDGENILKAAYDYLKSRPEFSETTDV